MRVIKYGKRDIYSEVLAHLTQNYYAVLVQKAVSAHFTSKQILHFTFPDQYSFSFSFIYRCELLLP